MENGKATGLVFTSITCPHCPIAKSYFEELRSEREDIDLHEVSVNNQEGQALAKQFGVQSVPSFVFYGPAHAEPIGLVGAQTKDVLMKYMDVVVGKQSLEKKKGFLSRIFS